MKHINENTITTEGKPTKVVVHAGTRKTTMYMPVLRVGYTLNDPIALQSSTASYYRAGLPIQLADIHLAFVKDKLFQLIKDREDRLHLYLPPTVVEDADADDVWESGDSL